jgi:polyhydroxyalkanoate synthesis regulator phasin
MKNWMNYVMIFGLAANTALAAEGGDTNKPAAMVPPPDVMAPKDGPQRPPMTPEQMERIREGRKNGGQDRFTRFTPEQMEKMRAQREELMKLGEAARNATDPAAKDALIAQIRTKLNEIADDMQAEGQKRLAEAEDQLEKLKKRLADAEKNRDARIEEQLQRILSGERPGGRHSDSAFGKGQEPGAPAPPPAE